MVAIAGIIAATSGCYLSHGRSGEGPRDTAGRDGGTLPDARIAAPDSGPRAACCTRWTFDRRVTADYFDDDSVTPRLIGLEDRPAVVIAGPSDPVGPSGAHLVRYTRDLGTHDAPVAVTRGSFTWGQPASAGDGFAVCWGSAGNIARTYAPSGAPAAPEEVLSTTAASPCLDAAYGAGVFGFAWVGPPSARMLNVRTLNRSSGALGTIVELPMGESQAVSMAGIEPGFVVAIPGVETSIFELRGEAGGSWASIGTGPSRATRVLWDGDHVVLIRVFDRPVVGERREDVWTYETFAVPGLMRRVGERELARFEPGPSPRFAATVADCGEVMLGTARAELAAIEIEPIEGGVRLHTYAPDAPDPGTFVGDSSVLSIGDDAYVAFSSIEPGAFRSRVKIDHWICTEH